MCVCTCVLCHCICVSNFCNFSLWHFLSLSPWTRAVIFFNFFLFFWQFCYYTVTPDARAHAHTHIHFTAVGDPSEGFRFRELRHQEDVVFFWSVHSQVKNFGRLAVIRRTKENNKKKIIRKIEDGSYCVLFASVHSPVDQHNSNIEDTYSSVVVRNKPILLVVAIHATAVKKCPNTGARVLCSSNPCSWC